jgi:DNA-binding response OmpR family regulator
MPGANPSSGQPFPLAIVLVVDDDPNLLRMLRRGLGFAGYTVWAAEDGEDRKSVV